MQALDRRHPPIDWQLVHVRDSVDPARSSNQVAPSPQQSTDRPETCSHVTSSSNQLTCTWFESNTVTDQRNCVSCAAFLEMCFLPCVSYSARRCDFFKRSSRTALNCRDQLARATLIAMLAQINALPRPQYQVPIGYGNQLAGTQHRSLDVRWHIVGAFDRMHQR